jgi:hypothetical protein
MCAIELEGDLAPGVNALVPVVRIDSRLRDRKQNRRVNQAVVVAVSRSAAATISASAEPGG